MKTDKEKKLEATNAILKDLKNHININDFSSI